MRKILKIPRYTFRGDNFGTTYEKIVLIVKFFPTYHLLAKLCITASA